MKAKIVRVDMFGYCGREYHPEPSDEGLVVTLVGLTTEVYTRDGAFLGHADQFANPEVMSAVASGDEDLLVSIWTGVTPDGRVLELVDYEIEFLSKVKGSAVDAAMQS